MENPISLTSALFVSELHFRHVVSTLANCLVFDIVGIMIRNMGTFYRLKNSLRVLKIGLFMELELFRKSIQLTLKKISGLTGDIFFKDYWQRTVNGKKESFRNRSGDHIDLWNGSRITDWFSWVRIHMRFGNFGVHSLRGDVSDFKESKAIWFWSVA
jgi:hypothetical protein